MTKKIISDLALTFGLQTGYQGSTKTLFVKGEEDKFVTFRQALTNLYVLAELPFVVKYSQDIPADVEKDEPIGNPGIPGELVANDEMIPGQRGEQGFTDPASNQNRKTEISKEQRALLDKYLVENPIDRKQKGCYATAAGLFEVGEEYVRDRYRKLRAKGLVEKEKESINA